MTRARLLGAGSAMLVSAVAALAQTSPPAPPAGVAKITEPQDDYADFSPDGRRLVFQSNRSGSWQLWLVNRDGTGLQRLTRGGANDRTPDWSPDGSQILFSSDRSSAPADRNRRLPRRDIFVIDLSTGVDGVDARARRLTDSPTQDIHPKWTSDGRAIVFNRVSDAGERDSAEVMMMDRDGRQVRRVPLAPGINTYASLTPDGRRLIYRGTTRETAQGGEIENSDIFSAAADGSDRRRLTREAAFDGWPAISPDGRTIAFASRRSGPRYQLYLMPIEGGEPRQLTFGDVFHHTQPAWSPDGRQLVAYRWVADQAGEIGQLVWLDVPTSGDRPQS